MAKEKYELTARAKRKTHVLTIINGEHVNITGDAHTVKGKATKKSPARDYTYRKATQADLEAFYKQGSQNIVQIARESPSNSGSNKE